MESAKTRHETNHPVFMIYSKDNVDRIKKTLSTVGLVHEIYQLKIEYDHEGTETNRTIAILGKSFQKHHEVEHPKLRMNRFLIPDNFKLEQKTLCPVIPYNLGFRGDQIERIIENKMQVFKNAGILKEGDYQIFVPLQSRSKDIPRVNSFINFKDTVSDDDIYLIRAVLNNGIWSLDSPLFFKVRFPRPKKEEEKK